MYVEIQGNNIYIYDEPFGISHLPQEWVDDLHSNTLYILTSSLPLEGKVVSHKICYNHGLALDFLWQVLSFMPRQLIPPFWQ